MTFRKNIHPIEAILRVTIGFILVALAFVGPANPWFLFGIVPILTGIFRNCPVYSIFGFSTCSSEATSTSDTEPKA